MESQAQISVKCSRADSTRGSCWMSVEAALFATQGLDDSEEFASA